MKKHFTTHLIFAATAMASQQALAIGFGRVVSDAVLGETLNVTVPVNVEPGQRLSVDCVSTEVYFGESQLLATAVRTRVDPGTSNTEWLVRISTTTPIGEPVVDIAVSAGCGQRFLRRFTLFADPPLAGAARIAAPQSKSGAPTPLAAIAARNGASAGGQAAAQQGGAAQRVGRRKGPTMALANELNAPKPPTRHATVAASDKSVAATSSHPATAPADKPRLVLDGGYAHLKLDIEEPIIPAATAASGAAIALTDADDPEANALRTLEQNIQAMKRADQASRDQTAQLRTQLAQAQSRGDWLPWVAALLALAVAAAAALAWRLRQQARDARSAWFAESQASRSTPASALPEAVAQASFEAPVPTSPQNLPPPVTDRVVRDVPESATVDLHGTHVSYDLHELHDAGSGAVVSDSHATQPLDRSALANLMAQESNAPRELSVEELLDLEQQADFFIALGQEDAAVDLLMSHLRSAGGQSPLPYTKLLEIYRRQGDRSAYERTRARFNRRFNAYAPDWDTGPSAGRTLEDYPENVAMVQAAWASPIDAMAVLEGLLFKRDDTSELFDLPAYRDVLVLYSLARDLWQQGGGLSGTQVDVLLPLDDTYGTSNTPYPSAAALNEADLPLDLGGLPTSYEMGEDFPPTGLAGELDLEIPTVDEPRIGTHGAVNGRDDAVHATLDAMSLSPIDTNRPPVAPDWESSKPSPDEVPTKR